MIKIKCDLAKTHVSIIIKSQNEGRMENNNDCDNPLLEYIKC